MISLRLNSKVNLLIEYFSVKIQIFASTSFFLNSNFTLKNELLTHEISKIIFEILQPTETSCCTHDGLDLVLFLAHSYAYTYSMIFCKKKKCLQLHPITPSFSCKIHGMNGIPFLCNKNVLTLLQKNAFSIKINSIFLPLFLN